MKFPNKKIERAYTQALDKVFTHSPTFRCFTDSEGCKEYDYYAMLWLKDKNYLVQLPFDGKKLVLEYSVDSEHKPRLITHSKYED